MIIYRIDHSLQLYFFGWLTVFKYISFNFLCTFSSFFLFLHSKYRRMRKRIVIYIYISSLHIIVSVHFMKCLLFRTYCSHVFNRNNTYIHAFNIFPIFFSFVFIRQTTFCEAYLQNYHSKEYREMFFFNFGQFCIAVCSMSEMWLVDFCLLFYVPTTNYN